MSVEQGIETVILNGESRESALRALHETVHYKDAGDDIRLQVDNLPPDTLGRFLQEFRGRDSLEEILGRTLNGSDHQLDK